MIVVGGRVCPAKKTASNRIAVVPGNVNSGNAYFLTPSSTQTLFGTGIDPIPDQSANFELH